MSLASAQRLEALESLFCAVRGTILVVPYWSMYSIVGPNTLFIIVNAPTSWDCEAKECVALPGAYNGLVARLVAIHGFKGRTEPFNNRRRRRIDPSKTVDCTQISSSR